MCVIVRYDDKEIDHVGQLADAIGRENVVMYGVEPFREELCLCSVDHHATAAKIGCVAEDGVDVTYRRSEAVAAK